MSWANSPNVASPMNDDGVLSDAQIEIALGLGFHLGQLFGCRFTARSLAQLPATY